MRRRRPGRPPKYGQPMGRRITIELPKKWEDRAQQLVDDGLLSREVRRALDAYWSDDVVELRLQLAHEEAEARLQRKRIRALRDRLKRLQSVKDAYRRRDRAAAQITRDWIAYWRRRLGNARDDLVVDVDALAFLVGHDASKALRGAERAELSARLYPGDGRRGSTRAGLLKQHLVDLEAKLA